MENNISLLKKMPIFVKNYSPWIASLLAILLGISLYFGYDAWSRLQESFLIIEQQSEYLSGKKQEIQQINNQLGLAESNIAKKDAIIDDYQKTVKELGLKLDTLKGAKNVRPASKDTTVVVIKKQIIGGDQETSVDPTNPLIVAYNWTDPSGRFHLSDPDISISGNEAFSYKLKIRITGFILKDPSGAIQARQVIGQEIYNENGVDKLGPPLEIENNIYEYSVEKEKKNIFQIIHPRLYFLFDTNLDPGIGIELINFGRYFDYINLGVGPFVSFETNLFPNEINKTRLGVGVEYLFIPPILSTNIGIGLGISTPIDNFTKEIIFSGYLLFYITN